ncbi:PH domain-containing protein [Clostridium sardiniense]|uniref:PH domain-containing protein n=1 Tax=Clostridium sardiniense TaxID=29369 RepID=A0ABS7KUC7_CLOSR|nr:PH domain-containing protein [Clostridium sardiniense]MBY0754324.1 PH domain-containing protein [Clostridium sardiniense]MDQ0461056.1 hypothetical protein [Clostridium sardiniense]
MFTKIASDALGLSDIGKIISPSDYHKVDSDDYIFNEDGEKIFFLIKSKSDEYCFTNKALIHVDGQNAISKKRNLYRYDYYKYKIDNVSLETAGTVDLDVEIKFSIGDKFFSIDVDKKQLEQLKDLYKALIKIQELTHENTIGLDISYKSLEMAERVLTNTRKEGIDVNAEMKAITEFAYNWMTGSRNTYVVKDFSDVFKKYIEN